MVQAKSGDSRIVDRSALDPSLSEDQRRRELCRRFYGDELAQAAFPQSIVKRTDRVIE